MDVKGWFKKNKLKTIPDLYNQPRKRYGLTTTLSSAKGHYVGFGCAQGTVRCWPSRNGMDLWWMQTSINCSTAIYVWNVLLISLWTQWPPFRRPYFQMHFRKWFTYVFWLKFQWILFLRSNWQLPSIGLDNGLAPNRRQAIIWIDANPIRWRIYAVAGGNELINQSGSITRMVKRYPMYVLSDPTVWSNF